MEIISWILFIVLIAGLLTIGGLLLRGYLKGEGGGGLLAGGLFVTKPPQKRLDVVDQATIDGRRRLVLIRRDNVEHLIMTGGPVDIVIETNISLYNETPLPEPLRPALNQTELHSTNDKASRRIVQRLDKAAGG